MLDSMMTFDRIFSRPLIGVLHLLPLPGSPLYGGAMDPIRERMLTEAKTLRDNGVQGLILENFGDAPFFPESVPVETVAAMAALAQELRREVDLPLGINVLRNDGEAAMAIATVTGASFIRVNVYMHASIGDQGLLQGRSYAIRRLKEHLKSEVLIFADVAVKHASPLGTRRLEDEVHDLSERGLLDALIVSGACTGGACSPDDLQVVKAHSQLPVLIGSGVTVENASDYAAADGWIVGSCLKEAGLVANPVDPERVRILSEALYER